MRRIHRFACAAAGLGLLIGSLSSCDSGSDEQAPEPPDDGPSATAGPSEQAPQDVSELGPALDLLVHGAEGVSTDGGRCFTLALREHEVTPRTEQVIVTAGLDDWGPLEQTVRSEVDEEQAETLLSQNLRRDLDACVNTQLGTEEDVKAVKVEPAAREVERGEPNLEPKYTFGENQSIYSPNDLLPGVVSMFTSFAPDSAELIEASAKCMSETIMSAGFSEETLLFIAGGAPIAHGSILEHLPDEQDRDRWASTQFLTSLSDCTTEEARKRAAGEDEDGEGPP